MNVHAEFKSDRSQEGFCGVLEDRRGQAQRVMPRSLNASMGLLQQELRQR